MKRQLERIIAPFFLDHRWHTSISTRTWNHFVEESIPKYFLVSILRSCCKSLSLLLNVKHFRSQLWQLRQCQSRSRTWQVEIFTYKKNRKKILAFNLYVIFTMQATKKGVHLATSVKNTQQQGLGAKKKSWSNWLGKKIYRGFSATVPYNYVTGFPHNTD